MVVFVCTNGTLNYNSIRSSLLMQILHVFLLYLSGTKTSVNSQTVRPTAVPQAEIRNICNLFSPHQRHRFIFKRCVLVLWLKFTNDTQGMAKAIAESWYIKRGNWLREDVGSVRRLSWRMYRILRVLWGMDDGKIVNIHDSNNEQCW